MSEGYTAFASRSVTATKRAEVRGKIETAQFEWKESKADFIASLRATHSTNTCDAYEVLLGQLIAWAERQGLTLGEFRARNLDRYLLWRKEQPSKNDPSKTIADTTRRKEAIGARLFFRFCYRRGLVDTDVLKDYALPRGNRKLPGMPSEKEISRLLSSIRRHWDPGRNPIVKFTPAHRRNFYEARNVAIIAGLAQTGARPGELLGLLMADYDTANLKVTFRDTKTKVDREVPIKQEWVEIVKVYLKVRPRMSPAKTLFVNDYGEVISVRSFAQTLRRMLDYCNECQSCRGTGFADKQGRSMLSKTGRRRRKPTEKTDTCAACAGTGEVANPLGKWSLRGFRHYAITTLCEQGVDVAQQIAGHKSIATTQLYNQIGKARIRAAFDAADLCPIVDDEAPIMVNKRSAKSRKRRLV